MPPSHRRACCHEGRRRVLCLDDPRHGTCPSDSWAHAGRRATPRAGTLAPWTALASATLHPPPTAPPPTWSAQAYLHFASHASAYALGAAHCQMLTPNATHAPRHCAIMRHWPRGARLLCVDPLAELLLNDPLRVLCPPSPPCRASAPIGPPWVLVRTLRRSLSVLTWDYFMTLGLTASGGPMLHSTALACSRALLALAPHKTLQVEAA